MSDGRCICCDLPTASCGKAFEQRDREVLRLARQTALALPYVLEARFAGSCPQCRSPIVEGDPIVRVGEDWIGVLCCGRAP